MNVTDLIAAFELPAEARVDQRVPKKLLVENGAPTAADKRWINDGIEEIQWFAALKPTTVGVPVYRDEQREYLEIAALSVLLRPRARPVRLAELIHRAVPYPVLLVLSSLTEPDSDAITSPALSLADKRWSQNEAGKVVLDGELVVVELTERNHSVLGSFLSALALARQPSATLYSLYQGWLAAALALQAACITGSFVLPGTPEDAAQLRLLLDEYDRLQRAIEKLRAQAKKEKRINRQVELNLEIRRLAAQADSVKAQL